VDRHGLAPLIVDPVLVTSHGELLLEPDGLDVLRRVLLPLAAVLTPNLPEAEALLGHPIPTRAAMAEAAAELAALGPDAVLLKGGHLGGDRSPDLLWNQGVSGRVRPGGAWRGHSPGLPPGQGVRGPRHRGRPGRRPGDPAGEPGLVPLVAGEPRPRGP
jgi:hydroxymethylpyrimidine/phosphomethylpyrimidine kinase